MKVDGTGSYIIATDYGLEGFGIHRYKTIGELLADIQSERWPGQGFIICRELMLGVKDGSHEAR